MTEKEKSIYADATCDTSSGIGSIDSGLALGGHGLGIGYDYGVMPVSFLVMVAFTLGEAAYGLYKWFKN
jgi:hypothetical protein